MKWNGIVILKNKVKSEAPSENANILHLHNLQITFLINIFHT